jgi:hypothetical protein
MEFSLHFVRSAYSNTLTFRVQSNAQVNDVGEKKETYAELLQRRVENNRSNHNSSVGNFLKKPTGL